MAVIGIDLGTTNSLAAYWKDGEARLICDERGEALLPSVVSYVEGEGFLVGAAAKERLLFHGSDTAASFKRFMGTAKEYRLGDGTYTPVELSAMVLGRIKRNAEYFLKEEIEEAIVTVPAYFNDKQRSDTKKAAQIAGLKAERLINEPSAAALAYRMHCGGEEKSLIIFDFGGGTLDLSYVECFDNVIEITAVAGDNHLGGDDIDRLIGEYFCRANGLDALSRENTQPPGDALSREDAWPLGDALSRENTLSMEDRAQIRKLSEKSKCTLESQDEVHMELEIAGRQCSAVLNEDILFEIAMPVFAKIKQLFLHLLEDADSRISEIDDLVMVGGSSRLKVVKRFLRELLGKEPVVLGDADKVVAMGAGVYAGIRQRREEVRDMLLTDVCPFTLGIGVFDRGNAGKNILSPMIERNSTLPAFRRKRFVTVHDYQRVIEVRIYQGEEYYVDNNVFLGEISIDVAQKPAGQAWIDVGFTYDINGILQVAVANETGESKRALLANQSLSDAELELYAREMEKVVIPPIQQPENQAMLEKLSACYENSTGARRERISLLIDQFTFGLNSGRRKDARDAARMAENWLEHHGKEEDIQEEILFDGELKQTEWEED